MILLIKAIWMCLYISKNYFVFLIFFAKGDIYDGTRAPSTKAKVMVTTIILITVLVTNLP